jgi:hypothetical protein
MDAEQAKTFTLVHAEGDRLITTREPVRYTRLVPGENLIDDEAQAAAAATSH